MGTFPPPALRTRRADFRHRALQWNHAARTRASRSRPADGSREPWHQAHTLGLAGRCVVRPVDALATATARVVPFACACGDRGQSVVSYGSSRKGLRGVGPSPSSTRAAASTPAEPVGAPVARFPTAVNQAGRLPQPFIPPTRRLLCLYRNWTFRRVEERRVTGRGRWLIRRFRNRAAGRVPWVRFLPPLSEPGVPISGTGLSSGIMRLAHGLPGHDQRTGLASPGTRLAPLGWPAGASSGLLTPWRRRPLGSSPSLVHVVTSGVPAHLRGDRPSATPVSLLPFAITST